MAVPGADRGLGGDGQRLRAVGVSRVQFGPDSVKPGGTMKIGDEIGHGISVGFGIIIAVVVVLFVCACLGGAIWLGFRIGGGY